MKQKTIFILLGIILHSLNVTAQIDSAKLFQVKTQTIDSICKCISLTDTNSVNTIDDARVMLTKCIGGNMDLLIKYAEEKTGKDITNIPSEQMQSISTEIASELYTDCPAMAIMVKRVKSKNK